MIKTIPDSKLSNNYSKVTTNSNRCKKIALYLDELSHLCIPTNRYAIVGSGPLAIRGIRDPSDLDVVVENNTFSVLLRKYDEYVQNDGSIKLGHLEIRNKWLENNAWANNIIKEHEVIEGYSFSQLKSVIKTKLILKRKKDFRDLRLLAQYLSENNIYCLRIDELNNL